MKNSDIEITRSGIGLGEIGIVTRPWSSKWRTGHPVFYDGFEGLSAIGDRYEVFGDAGGSAALSPDSSLEGDNSILVTADGDVGDFYTAQLYAPPIFNKQLGFEGNIALGGNTDRLQAFGFGIVWYDRATTAIWRAVIKYLKTGAAGSDVQGKFQYLTSGSVETGTYTDIPGASHSVYKNTHIYHYYKLIADFDTLMYDKLIFDDQIIDMSDLAISVASHTNEPGVLRYDLLSVWNADAVNTYGCFVDAILCTIREPI